MFDRTFGDNTGLLRATEQRCMRQIKTMGVPLFIEVPCGVCGKSLSNFRTGMELVLLCLFYYVFAVTCFFLCCTRLSVIISQRKFDADFRVLVNLKHAFVTPELIQTVHT